MNERSSRPPDGARPRSVGRRLTDRQAAILVYIAGGLENKEIAQRLAVSEQSVKEQVSNLLRRLAVRNRAALAEIATQLRIVGTVVDQSWLSHLFADAPFGVALLRGPELRFVAWNGYYGRYVGDRALADQSLREAFPEWSESAFEIFERVYATGEPFAAHEYAGRWDRLGKGPGEGYADFVVQALRDDAGDINGLLVMYIDVTDTVRSRRELDELAAEEEAILDQVPSGVIVFDRDGTIVRLNAHARRSAPRLRPGDRMPELFHGLEARDVSEADSVLDLGDALARVLRGEAIAQRDVQLRRDGRVVGVARASAKPLHDGQGRVRGAVAVFTWSGAEPEA